MFFRKHKTSIASTSPNQERYLLAERASPDASYLQHAWYHFIGPLDVGRMRRALETVVARHQTLRTAFVPDVDTNFRAIVHDKPQFHFRTGKIAAANSAEVARAVQPFLSHLDDFSDPAALQHYSVLKVNDNEWVLALNRHHAIMDGVSGALFLTDLARAYNGEKLDPAPAPDNDDYGTDADRLFFRETFAGMEGAPRFHRDLASGGKRMAAAIAHIDAELTEQFATLARQSSSFSAMGAAFAITIGLQTGEEDVAFIFQSAGRRHVRTPDAIAAYSNTLPLRVQLKQEESFASLADRVKQTLHATLDHEGLAYHHILRETDISPDFELNLFPQDSDLPFDGLQLGPREFLPIYSESAINLRVKRRQDAASRPYYTGEAFYNAGEISHSRVEAFNTCFVRILELATARPDASIAELIAATRPEQTAPPALPTLQPVRLYERVYEAADAAPHATAILSANEAPVDYQTLKAMVESRAAELGASGATSGRTIAFLAERNRDFVVTMLALSRTGARFAVLDAEYPDSRLAEMLAVLKPDLLVAASSDLTQRMMVLADLSGVPAAIPTEDVTDATLPLPPAPQDDELAYYLLTSGTTGQPRAVGVGHAALPAFIDWYRTRLSIGEGDRVSLLSGLAHDPVMRDIFLPLLTGATLAIPDADLIRDPRALTQWLRETGVTIIHTTPPMGQLLSEVNGHAPAFPALRFIGWGGDLLPQETVNHFRDANPELRQINFYGATETPQAVAWYESSADDHDRKIVPIGNAISLTDVHVADPQGRLSGVGEIGEVIVRTPYHVQIEGQPPAIGQTYATGDLAYQSPEGAIQVIGRADDQVKVRGYRVELADVRKHLERLPGVAEALVLADKAPDGNTILVAHARLTDAPGTNEIANAERQALARLRQTLPAYMVPARLIIHQAFPLLPNGKIDRKALRAAMPAINEPDTAVAREEEPRSKQEQDVIDIFERVIGRKVPSLASSFADLGADSLNSIQAMMRLEALIPVLPTDWPEMDIRTLAGMIGDDPVRRRSLWHHLRPVPVEPSMALRAVAILLIAAFHFRVATIGGGMTFVFFFLSGVAFARYQQSLLLNGDHGILLQSMLKLIIISFPVCLAYALKILSTGDPSWIMFITFVSNFINFVDYPIGHPVLMASFLWFISCFVQLYLFLFIMFRIPAFCRSMTEHPYTTLLAAFLLLAVLRFIIPEMFNPGGVHDIHRVSRWAFLPTTHFATFALGMLLVQAFGNMRRILVVSLLAIVYCYATYRYFPGNNYLVITGSILFVAFVPTIFLPHFMVRAVGYISQASLMIYLLHQPGRLILTKVGIDNIFVVLLIISIAATIIGVVYNDVYSRVMVRIKHMRAPAH